MIQTFVITLREGVEAALVIAIAVIAAFWPRVLAWPLAFICTWLGIAWTAKAIALKRRAQQQAADATLPAVKAAAGGGEKG